MLIQRVAVCVAGFIGLSMAVLAGDEPPAPAPAPPAEVVLPGPDSVKPLPLAPIPDDPPPHEGAMIDLSCVIEPPDMVMVEVLEALPGRPIAGERLVRPDGKINLGFYGDVSVRGLTLEQAKAKIVLHLRAYLDDELLGLVVPESADGAVSEDAPAWPHTYARSNAGAPVRLYSTNDREPKHIPHLFRGPVHPHPMKTRRVAPADTDRVFVEITQYNSKFYFVHGVVGSPGRMPFTGNETVLDALSSAGGLIPGADPKEIRLHRPARGGKPAKVYSIDYSAISRNEAALNYQLFPGDRLVVGGKR